MVGFFNKIISLFRRFRKAEIVKVFSFTTISTLVKMLTGFISVKIVAIIIGPSGIALLGQLNNFTNIALSVASGGINSGITKYIAEYKESENKTRLFLSTALKITLCASILCGVILILFSGFISRKIFFDSQYQYVFTIFGFTIIFYALNNLILSIINGFKEFKKYVRISIANSLVGLIFTVCLVWLWELKGALISAVTFQSVMFFITLWMAAKSPWLQWKNFSARFNSPIAKKYLHYTLMTFVVTLAGPLSQLILRSYIITNISALEAGQWEAMNRLSGMYLMVITTAFSVYYLPRLSELKERTELRHEIFKAYKLIVPLLLIGLLLVYFFRFYIIKILFTAEFIPMEKLFSWQLTGDFFKISSWLLSFIMVAKSKTAIFITTEIVFSVLFVGLGLFFINMNGVVGITQAYMINYIIYLTIMVVLFRKILF